MRVSSKVTVEVWLSCLDLINCWLNKGFQKVRSTGMFHIFSCLLVEYLFICLFYGGVFSEPTYNVHNYTHIDLQWGKYCTSVTYGAPLFQLTCDLCVIINHTLDSRTSVYYTSIPPMGLWVTRGGTIFPRLKAEGNRSLSWSLTGLRGIDKH